GAHEYRNGIGSHASPGIHRLTRGPRAPSARGPLRVSCRVFVEPPAPNANVPVSHHGSSLTFAPQFWIVLVGFRRRALAHGGAPTCFRSVSRKPSGKF